MRFLFSATLAVVGFLSVINASSASSQEQVSKYLADYNSDVQSLVQLELAGALTDVNWW
jgi:hypothetical protein